MVQATSRRQVLLAEDNPVNTELALAVLALVDCDVTPVEDGLRALEACKQKRAHGLNPAWIVALTGSAMPEEYQHCIDAGMDEVLTKPMDVNRLRDLVSDLCRREHANLAKLKAAKPDLFKQQFLLLQERFGT